MGKDVQSVKQMIEEGKAVAGIELGSTRIKTVLIGEDHEPVASGSYDWENELVDGLWTYSLDAVTLGLLVGKKDAFAALPLNHFEGLGQRLVGQCKRDKAVLVGRLRAYSHAERGHERGQESLRGDGNACH